VAVTRDLYEILGVRRNATEDEIRKADRRLAREHHPDVNAAPEAEARFKEISGAYEILGDPVKRQQYDLYGTAGTEAFPFGDVSEIFDVFFGGGGFGTRRRPRRRSRMERGEDVFTSVSVAFEEAVFGAQRDLAIDVLETCTVCGGNGCRPGTSPTTCQVCAGSGEVQDMRRSVFGTVMTTRPCTTCEATGEVITDPCETCRRQGRVPHTRPVPLEIPAGISDGLEMRMSGGGNAGRMGGAPGDLYVTFRVQPHRVFDRQGQDLFAVLDVPMERAALGVDVEVETLDGTERVKLDAGAQSGDVVRLKGKGVPNLGRRGRGDLFLTLHVETPKKLGREERKLLERLEQLRGDDARSGLRHPATSPPRAGMR
jgi:molecular chaperone DnaJ